MSDHGAPAVGHVPESSSGRSKARVPMTDVTRIPSAIEQGDRQAAE
jgi:hypothetical protein